MMIRRGGGGCSGGAAVLRRAACRIGVNSTTIMAGCDEGSKTTGARKHPIATATAAASKTTTISQCSSPSSPIVWTANSSTTALSRHRHHLRHRCSRQHRHRNRHHFSSTAEEPASLSSLSSSDQSSTSTTVADIDDSVRDEVVLISKEDEHKEEKLRTRLSDVLISEVLKAKHSHRWVDPVIHCNATVSEAIQIAIEGGLSGMMVVEQVDEQKKVIGLITSRDLLRIMAGSIKDGDKTSDQILNQGITAFMTPISQVIYGRPHETIGMCRTIMAKLGIKALPILSKEGRVEGLITARDMSDFGLSAADKGGKKNYLNDISERVGLSSDTSMAEPPTYLHAHLAMEQTPLFTNIGIAELPHPFKTSDSQCGANQREHGPRDPTTNVDLSEDAYFVTQVKLHNNDDKEGGGGTLRDATYFGVADGVGSWRQFGVDPKEFSHRLMEECNKILLEAACTGSKYDDFGNKFPQRVVTPSEVLAKAYERVQDASIIGSSTACVALFDGIRHQLHFANLGDSGIIVLRHIDSEVAGSLKREKMVPRTERKSDLRTAFVSQQQLHSFNHPYQLGWTGEDMVGGEKSSFKDARDSCVTSVHLRRGDLIIMATDGLFDNVEIDDIEDVALRWEQKNGFIRGGDISARTRRWEMGNSLTVLSSETVDDLAKGLCELAREKSLDSSVDSPFAILAKENDIMWSGGMPDDCTVVVAHVVGRAADDVMDKDHL